MRDKDSYCNSVTQSIYAREMSPSWRVDFYGILRQVMIESR